MEKVQLFFLFISVLLITLGSTIVIISLKNNDNPITEEFPPLEDLPSLEDECSWTPDQCDKFCPLPNFNFNSELSKCLLWPGASCCTDPPFKTLAECQTTCEN